MGLESGGEILSRVAYDHSEGALHLRRARGWMRAYTRRTGGVIIAAAHSTSPPSIIRHSIDGLLTESRHVEPDAWPGLL